MPWWRQQFELWQEVIFGVGMLFAGFDPRSRRAAIPHKFDPSEKAHEQMMSEHYGYKRRPRTSGGLSRGGY